MVIRLMFKCGSVPLLYEYNNSLVENNYFHAIKSRNTSKAILVTQTSSCRVWHDVTYDIITMTSSRI